MHLATFWLLVIVFGRPFCEHKMNAERSPPNFWQINALQNSLSFSFHSWRDFPNLDAIPMPSNFFAFLSSMLTSDWMMKVSFVNFSQVSNNIHQSWHFGHSGDYPDIEPKNLILNAALRFQVSHFLTLWFISSFSIELSKNVKPTGAWWMPIWHPEDWWWWDEMSNLKKDVWCAQHSAFWCRHQKKQKKTEAQTIMMSNDDISHWKWFFTNVSTTCSQILTGTARPMRSSICYDKCSAKIYFCLTALAIAVFMFVFNFHISIFNASFI